MNSDSGNSAHNQYNVLQIILSIAFIIIFIVVPFIRWVLLGDIPKDIKTLKVEVTELHSSIEELTSKTSLLASEVSSLRLQMSLLNSTIDELRSED